jgi:hypothetical protein
MHPNRLTSTHMFICHFRFRPAFRFCCIHCVLSELRRRSLRDHVPYDSLTQLPVLGGTITPSIWHTFICPSSQAIVYCYLLFGPGCFNRLKTTYDRSHFILFVYGLEIPLLVFS